MRIDLGGGFSINLIAAAILAFGIIWVLVSKLFQTELLISIAIAIPIFLTICFGVYIFVVRKPSSKGK